MVGQPVSGAEFEMMRYRHVYLPKEGLVILGDHVTLESGSGCVHTAGGHGVDDFNVSQKYNVPITVPVDDGGYLTELSGKYAGQKVWDANKTILADLTAPAWCWARCTSSTSTPTAALPQPHHLPRHRAVVLLHRRLQGRGLQGHRRRPVDARVGP